MLSRLPLKPGLGSVHDLFRRLAGLPSQPWFFAGALFSRLIRSFTPANLPRRVHCLSAIRRSAIAPRFILVAVVEIVIVRQFFARRDIPQGNDPYAAVPLVRLAVWIARVIDKHRRTVTVDHRRSIAYAEKVGHRRVLITLVRYFLRNARTGVLYDQRVFCDVGCCVAASCVNGGGTNNQTHLRAEYNNPFCSPHPIRHASKLEMAMRGFLLGAGLLGAMFFIGGAKLLVSQQQTSSPTKSDQAKSAAKGGAKTDPANAVPDAPQPQKEPATNAPDSSGAHSDATGPSESESEKKTSSNKDVPPQRTPDAPNKPSTSDRPTEANNPFPEDVSRRAAQQDTQETPAAPASSGEEPASPPEHTAAGDNPFPEDISRKAAKASGDPASGSGGASQENPPNVPLPPGVSSSQSSALPDPSQTRHALGIVDATRAKKDNQVGDFYLAGGNFKGAYERYKDATTHDPTNVDAIFGLAEASKGLKQFAEAQHNYLLYLDILPNGPKAKQALKALTAIEGKQ